MGSAQTEGQSTPSRGGVARPWLQAAAMTPESTPYRTGSTEADARVTARTQAD